MIATRRFAAIAFALASALAAPARAEEGRFDAQVFRPSAAPRDLVMVQKSEIIGHLSPVVGTYIHYSLNPLGFFLKDTGQTVSAVGGRLELVGMAGLGLFDWVDLGVAVPFIPFQTGDNLRDIGSEGSVATTVMGDIRLSARVAIPYLNRRAKIKEGFGMALAGNVNFPTGNVNAFAGEGTVTGGFSLIADYRFSFGLVLALNGGMWLRPDREFGGIRIGHMASFGLGAEMVIVKKWGLSVLANGFGYASLLTFPDSPRQIPIEALLGLRWQGKHGVSVTVGGSFGADCGFGVPAFRFFTSITWQPKRSREQEQIERLKQYDSDDPDRDGLIAEKDKCPNLPGPIDNEGCPDPDSDEDGVPDRLDGCPEEKARPGVKDGCVQARVRGNKITLDRQVAFATDAEVIMPGSYRVLEDAAWVMKNHPEITLLLVEAHTDSRGTAAYNLALSNRRAESVMRFLEEHGVERARMRAEGFGATRPRVDDKQCRGIDKKSWSGKESALKTKQELDAKCAMLAKKNRRVELTVEKVDPEKVKKLPKGVSPASELPSGELREGGLREGELPEGELPEGELPQGGSFPSGERPLDAPTKDPVKKKR